MTYLVDQFLAIYSPVTAQGVLFVVWAVSFIVLPIIRKIWGPTGEKWGTAAGVISCVALVSTLLAGAYGLWSLLIILGVPLGGWLSEFVGSRTGYPFGPYHYTTELRPQIGDVPILIPLAWLMMMPSSWALAGLIAPESPLAQWLIAAAAFTSWDLFVDPQMVTRGYWVWEKPGPYMGIPLVNFAGWFLVAFVLTALFSVIPGPSGPGLVHALPVAPLFAVFVITWVLQTIGHLFFWKLRTSGLAGFLGMGFFVALAIIRSLGAP